MAREKKNEKMVTRTFDMALVTCMCLNVEKAEVSINTFEIVGLYAGKTEKALQEVKRISETNEFKIVAVQKIEQFERLYGMTESEFIAYAKTLPPRGNKTE